ncbi:HAD-like domain-containing protein [Annulohypoxylon maeteangense]|uniref:HAD-like domain-containing protein n=1 Tax=Annulohypoxylon maeteangense TaxID=1927788 RepID=UPI0020084232|nr:HAD-like domain-containing protein [Annulohypoxylon maeteangense]KAI0883876.1 HAD-like domain-containing protein [Annulohypoxylon maeteangense]
MTSKFKAIIFDLGGVLLHWNSEVVTDLSPSQLQTMMDSPVWFDLERGHLTLQEACQNLSKLVGIDAQTIEHGLDEAQQSLEVDTDLAQTVKELRASDENLQLVVMSNISQEHFRLVQRLHLPWSLFNFTFASGAVGMRKPDLCFFQHVIDKIGVHPSDVVMVDDRVENIHAARTIGIHGILVDSRSSLEIGQVLKNMLFDSVSKAQMYMKNNAGNHISIVEGQNLHIRENFSQLLIWELTGDADIIFLKWPSGKIQDASVISHGAASIGDSIDRNVENGLWNFWCDQPVLTTREFPADADTTSIAYLSIPANHFGEMADVQLVMEKMAMNTDSDGILQTYFIEGRPRTSPEVCCNILRVFYRFGYKQGIDPRTKKTQEWVIRCLRNRSYVNGTRYYSTPEVFLYLVTRLYVECNQEALRKDLGYIKEALLERINLPTNALALALRISACQSIGIDKLCYKNDLQILKSLQEEDGGWPAGHIYRFGKIGACIGNRGLTTALAVKIIRYENELNSK